MHLLNTSSLARSRQVPLRSQKMGPAGQKWPKSAAAGQKDGSSGPETVAKCRGGPKRRVQRARNGRKMPRRAQKTGLAGQKWPKSAAAGPEDGSSGPETAAKCASREDVPLTNMVRRILPPDKGFFYFSFKHKGSFYGPDASLHFLG